MATERLRLSQMISGYWVSQMLHVATRLQLADHLRSEPKTVAELAQLTETHARSLGRLLRGLASVGIFAETSPGTFTLTPQAEYLRDDHPATVRPMALMMGGVQYQAWGELLHSVQTGETGFQHRYGQPLFDYLGEHPEQAAEFDRAMVSIHGGETAAIIDAYDLSAFQSLMDVGGGNGSQLIEILHRHPRLRGQVFDLPHVAERAQQALIAAGLGERGSAVGGSFFDSVPSGAEAYLLRHVIHDWSDEQSQHILSLVRKAIPANGRLLVIETVIPPGNDPSFAKLLDLTMLVIPGGIERTESEYRELFEASGFRLNRIVPTAAGVDVIEGVPV
ncbi:methyltransferase [bacterium]|nr:methyltransferase [bacterium]